MKIYILIDGSEIGPYTKPEIFALLKDGSLSMNSPARLESEEEYSLLSEVLKRGGNKFFSVQQIEERQIEEAEKTVIVPDLAIQFHREPVAATPPPRKRYGLAAACVLLAICSVVWVVSAFRNNGGDEEFETPSSIAEVGEAVPIDPSQHPTPEETPETKIAAKPAPSPTPEIPVEIPPEALVVTRAEMPSETDSALFETIDDPIAHPEPTPEIAVADVPPPPTLTIEPRYRKAELAASKTNPQTDLWTIEYSDQPRGVILFCLDGPLESSDRIQKWENWKTLVRENHLILAVTGLKKMEPEFGNRLLMGLKELGLSNLPVLMYGRHVGGTFASSFALQQKDMVTGWAAYTGNVDLTASSSDQRPGLLITDFEDSKINNVKVQFQAGRKRGQKWTLLTLASDTKNQLEDAESFALDYFQALVNFKNGSECWATITNPGKADLVDISRSPQNVAWMPNDSLFEQWMTLMPVEDQTFDPVVTRKTVKTNVPQQPEFEMFLRLPPEGSGAPKPTGILAFTTWTQNSEDIEKQLLYRTDMKLLSAPGPAGIVARLIRYAEKNNLAVLTWNSTRFWRNDANSWELPKKERAELDRAFDRIAIAWELGLRDIRKETGISDKDMLLYGISRGAMWAQRLVVRMPHHFMAAHLHIPITFDTPTERGKDMLWLMTTGESDPGYEQCIKFYEQSRKLNYPILFKAIVNLGHDDHPIAEKLGFHFFDYALQLRDARLAAAEKESNPFKKKEILNTPLWASSFQDPPFVGDFLNQEMFPFSQVEMIPSALRVALPNEQLAEAWNK